MSMAMCSERAAPMPIQTDVASGTSRTSTRRRLQNLARPNAVFTNSPGRNRTAPVSGVRECLAIDWRSSHCLVCILLMHSLGHHVVAIYATSATDVATASALTDAR
jgi:hypothetical protein